MSGRLRGLALFYAFLGAGLVAGCGGGTDGEVADIAQTGEAAGEAANPAETVVELRESDVTGFIKAMAELKQLNLDVDARLGDNPDASISTMVESWSTSREAMEILERHGFDLPRFQLVTYSVAMAMAAEGAAEGQAQVQEASTEIESMKGKVSDEIYEQMKQGQAAALAATQAIMNQPAGNVALVKRYKAELEALGK